MNPAPTPPPYRIDWDDDATDDLADAFAAYFPSRQGIRVTRAEQIVNDLRGRPRAERVPPL